MNRAAFAGLLLTVATFVHIWVRGPAQMARTR